MKRKFLEDLGLEKEVIDKIMDEHGAGITAAKVDVQKLEDERNDLKSKYETAEQTITTLKAAESANETLQATIQSHETTIAKLQSDSDVLKKSYSLKDQLTKLGVNDPDYIIFKHGGVDKFTHNQNGEIIGLEDTINPYKESIPHVFKTETPATVVIEGNPAGDGGTSDPNPGGLSIGQQQAQRYNALVEPAAQ